MILRPHIAQMRMEAARERQSPFAGSRFAVAWPPNEARGFIRLLIPRNARTPRISLHV